VAQASLQLALLVDEVLQVRGTALWSSSIWPQCMHSQFDTTQPRSGYS
jgi:hypothetical protein